MLLADELFLGHDLLAWLVLAMGAALAVGNIAALVRPPNRADGPAPDALRRRAMIFDSLAGIASIAGFNPDRAGPICIS